MWDRSRTGAEQSETIKEVIAAGKEVIDEDDGEGGGDNKGAG